MLDNNFATVDFVQAQKMIFLFLQLWKILFGFDNLNDVITPLAFVIYYKVLCLLIFVTMIVWNIQNW